jgi:hypothetical protein
MCLISPFFYDQSARGFYVKLIGKTHKSTEKLPDPTDFPKRSILVMENDKRKGCPLSLSVLKKIVHLLAAFLCGWVLTSCAGKRLAEVVSVNAAVWPEPLSFKPVSVKEEFLVVVTTVAGGCTEPGETRVKVSGLRAEIRPYNRIRRSLGGRRCLRYRQDITRHIPLRFDAPGVATIQVIGQGQRGESQLIERQVQVK